MTSDDGNRIVCNFSCGAASAVATKITLSEHKTVEIINAFIVEEHKDNRRFLVDCEKWFGQKITVLKDKKYGASVLEVFRKKQFIKSRNGAPCSSHLKRELLDAWELPDDVMVLGFTAEERDRYELFQERNPNRKVDAPLIRHGLEKSDCLSMVERAGIDLPMMYKLGYHNSNCIACVKGGEGYMNKIRRDFPAEFEALAQVEESIGPGAYLFRDRKTGKRYSLRDLPQDKGRHDDEPDITCSFFCQMAEEIIQD